MTEYPSKEDWAKAYVLGLTADLELRGISRRLGVPFEDMLLGSPMLNVVLAEDPADLKKWSN